MIHFFDLCRFHILISWICRIKKIKTLCTIAYQNFAYGKIDDKTKMQLIKLLTQVDKVDVLFPNGQPYFEELTGKRNITVTPGTFTNLSVFQPADKENIMVFAAARLEKDKNAALLVKACILCQKELRSAGYKVYLLGQGFEEDKLRKLVAQNQLEDIIWMPGYKKSSEFFPRAKVYFTLDLIDNYPSQCIAEAAACGCYIIATEVGNTKRCSDPEFSKFICNSAEVLAASMVEYMNTPVDIQNQYVLKARKFAESQYSIDASVNYFYDLLTKDYPIICKR